MLKYLIAKFKLRIRHNRCYRAKENVGYAAFGMCSGHYHTEIDGGTPYKSCSVCPYFVKKGDM